MNNLSAQSLPTPVPLLPAELSQFIPSGEEVDAGRFETVDVVGQSFQGAVQVETLRRPPFPWNLRLGAATIAPIQKGDALLIQFLARRVKSQQETGEALIGVVVETTDKTHRKLSESELSVGPDWTQISLPFIADQNADAGEIQISFRLGYKPQTLEIAGIRVSNFGQDVPISSLPTSKATYEGFAPNHPWRAAAASRIEKIRKGDLTVRVLDSKNQPVPGAMVEVRMKRHAFGFGTAIKSALVAGDDLPDHLRYREILETYFNKIVFENDLKWPAWSEPDNWGAVPRNQIFQTLDWLEERKIPARGHVMVWPSWQYTPKFLKSLKDQPEKLRAAILDHIADQTSTLGQRLEEWDVINESYAHHDLMDILGREAMVDWFRAAHAGAPNVKLFYNDYVMFSGEGPGSPSQYFEETIEFLVRQGAPIGGIGEQGHFGGSPPSPLKVLETFDRFSRFGLPIQISEFDIDTPDVDLQVAYTRDFLTAAFSHPAVTGVLSWGFWEGNHWKPRAAFWSKDWKLRPNGEVWVNLTTREWWTSEDLLTNEVGNATVRGFCGDYEVTVRPAGHGSAAMTRRVTLPREGALLEITLP